MCVSSVGNLTKSIQYIYIKSDILVLLSCINKLATSSYPFTAVNMSLPSIKEKASATSAPSLFKGRNQQAPAPSQVLPVGDRAARILPPKQCNIERFTK